MEMAEREEERQAAAAALAMERSRCDKIDAIERSIAALEEAVKSLAANAQRATHVRSEPQTKAKQQPPIQVEFVAHYDELGTLIKIVAKEQP